MQVTYIKDAAGIKAGKIKTVPDNLGKQLIDMGVCEFTNPIDKAETKEATATKTRQTKEEKSAAKSETK